MAKPILVGVVMGSKSDLSVMEEAFKVIDELGIGYEPRIISAHRTPDEATNYARAAKNRGLRIIIAGAGMAAHLAGAIAANTTLPVIGIPIDSGSLRGIDALLSTVQMPPGIPVATMAIGKAGATNAAIFAAEILAINDDELSTRLHEMRNKMALKVLQDDEVELKRYIENRNLPE